MKKISMLPILLLVLLCNSCSFKELEYRGYEHINIQKVGFSNSELLIDVKYYNPNNIGLELKEMDLDVYLNNNYLGHTSQKYQVKIPKKGEFVIPIKLSLDMKNLLKNAVAGVLNKEVSLTTSGKVVVGKGKLIKHFPFKYETKEKFSLFD